MGETSLTPNTLQRLQQRASLMGCSVDALVNHLLDASEPSPIPGISYADMLRYTSDVVALFNLDLQHIYVNEAIESIVGVTTDSLIGQTGAEVGISQERIEKWQAACYRAIHGKREELYAFYYDVPAGKQFYEARLTPILDDNDEPRYLLVITRDVTARVQAEQALREKQSFLDSVMRTVPSIIYIWDYTADQTVYANNGLTTILGYSVAEVLKMGSKLRSELIHPDDFKNLTDERRMIEESTDGTSRLEYRMRHSDGHYIWVQNHRTVYQRNENGDILQILGSIIDITALKEAEAALSEKHNTLQLSLEAAQAGVIVSDLEKNEVTWDVRQEAIYGLPPGGYDGTYEAWRKRVHPDDLEEVEQNLQNIIKGGGDNNKEFRIVWDDGSVHHILAHILPDPPPTDGLPKRLIGVNIDITAQKETQEALRRSEQRYQSVVNTQTELICRYTTDLRLTFVNNAYCQYFNETEQTLIGTSFLNVILQDDVEAVRERHLEMLAGLATDEGYKHRVLLPNGTVRWQYWTDTPLHDQNGEIIGVQAVGRDITDREEKIAYALENERLRANFNREQEQNELVRRIISSLSHDIRTPLTIIAMAADILDLYRDQLTEARIAEKMNSVKRQVQFALEMIDDTVELARGNLEQSMARYKPFNLDALCRVSIHELNETTSDRHQLTFTNTGEIGVVQGDEVLISRILLNLINNAVKYSPEGGEVALTLNYQDDGVQLIIRDEGVGISDDELPHITKPFYRAERTRGVVGKGLGLSIVQDCVRRHSGYIDIASEVGVGTTVTIWLPCRILESETKA